MISVLPITDEDLPATALFMYQHLNSNIPLATWVDAFSRSWAAVKPNNGFMLRDGDAMVGVLGAIYSDQEINGNIINFCNLTSLFIFPKYRGRTLALFAK